MTTEQIRAIIESGEARIKQAKDLLPQYKKFLEEESECYEYNEYFDNVATVKEIGDTIVNYLRSGISCYSTATDIIQNEDNEA